MDQIVNNSIYNQQNCIFHPQNKVAFIQVNEISTQPNSNIFQCADCFEQDLQFRGSNYMLISKIIENSETDFHYKWPPLNDQLIIQKIHMKAKDLNSTQTILNQINSFFSQLKDEIIKKIDVAQKKAINQALEIPFGKEQILKRYQEISQIQILKSLLLQEQNKSFDVYQKYCKDFIQQVEFQKDKNTKLLQELLNQCEKVQGQLNFDKLNLSKWFILDFLDQLNVFEDQPQNKLNYNSNETNISLQQQENTKVNQLMKLISNKTNYCSEEFLNQIRQQMQKLSLFFEQISFDKINQENKKAIRFSELSDEKINILNEYVDHMIKIQNNPQYLQSVKNSNRIQSFLNIFDNKFNFISSNYRDNFMEYLIETYPFQKYLNSDQIFSDEQSFNCLKSLEINYVNQFIKVLKKKQNFDENQQNFANSKTYTVQQQILKSLRIKQNELEHTLKQFPIFEFIEFQQKIFFFELQFQKSNFLDGNKRIEVVKNIKNQFEISINENDYQGNFQSRNTNCISQILQRDKKYIFRIQFKKGSAGYFRVGLMQNKNFNSKFGYEDQMSYQFQLCNKIQQKAGKGIDKLVKGDNEIFLNANITLELRVWIEGQQLQVLQYPNYNYQIEIKDELKYKLLQDDLCLYLGLYSNSDKCILEETLIVEQF